MYAVVLDLEATNQMDTTTAERLDGPSSTPNGRPPPTSTLVRAFGNVRDVLTKSVFLDVLGPDHAWHSIEAGVKAARSAPPIAVVLPDGAVLPGAPATTRTPTSTTSPSLDEPENGVHGEQIASKRVDPTES